jgi:DNA-binding HxlR family transcriptional regulator
LSEYTGIASNILSNRLKKLLAAEIITKTVNGKDARRFDYALTEKGMELFPVIMTLMNWGDRWTSGDRGPLVELTHIDCGARTVAGLLCSSCNKPLLPSTIRTHFSRAYRT